jgi:hypothetical protein
MAQKSMHEKMRLKEDDMIAAVNAPKDFEKALAPLPRGVKISKGIGKNYNIIYWFVKTQAEIESQMKMILDAIKNDTMVWIFYPKGTSGIQTDLTRDKGWDILMKRDDLSWVSMISYDDTWTAIAFRKKTDKDRRRESKPAERLIFQYADSKTKTIRLPDDMSQTLDKNKTAKEIFDALTFSNRREYLEWIITARREETRKQRLDEMVTRLIKGWKNPAGRN